MSDQLNFSRLVPELDGGSHFEQINIPVRLQDFAPPAQPFSVSPLSQASQCGFLQPPVGWIGEMHPSPLRMWILVLTGEMLFQASNEDTRHVKPGSALLLEDTTGRGHVIRVLGSSTAALAVVGLAALDAV